MGFFVDEDIFVFVHEGADVVLDVCFQCGFVVGGVRCRLDLFVFGVGRVGGRGRAASGAGPSGDDDVLASRLR